MFWKWRLVGYIIGYVLKKPVGTVKVRREEYGGLEALTQKIF